MEKLAQNISRGYSEEEAAAYPGLFSSGVPGPSGAFDPKYGEITLFKGEGPSAVTEEEWKSGRRSPEAYRQAEKRHQHGLRDDKAKAWMDAANVQQFDYDPEYRDILNQMAEKLTATRESDRERWARANNDYATLKEISKAQLQRLDARLLQEEKEIAAKHAKLGPYEPDPPPSSRLVYVGPTFPSISEEEEREERLKRKNFDYNPAYDLRRRARDRKAQREWEKNNRVPPPAWMTAQSVVQPEDQLTGIKKIDDANAERLAEILTDRGKNYGRYRPTYRWETGYSPSRFTPKLWRWPYPGHPDAGPQMSYWEHVEKSLRERGYGGVLDEANKKAQENFILSPDQTYDQLKAQRKLDEWAAEPENENLFSPEPINTQ